MPMGDAPSSERIAASRTASHQGSEKARPSIHDFFRIVFIFLPLGFFAPCLQAAIQLSLTEKGFSEVASSSVWSLLEWLPLSAFVVIPAETFTSPYLWMWVLSVVTVNSLAILAMRRRLPRFWTVSASWGGACIVGDLILNKVTDFAIWPDVGQAALGLGFNLTGGLFVGWLFYQPLARISLYSEASLQKGRSGQPYWALPPNPDNDNTRLDLAVSDIVTGYAAIGAFLSYLVFAYIILVIALLSAVEVLPSLLMSFVVFLQSWDVGAALTAFYVGVSFFTTLPLLLSLYWPGDERLGSLAALLPLMMLVVPAFSLYVVRRLYKAVRQTLLLYRRRRARVWLVVLTVSLVVGNAVAIMLRSKLTPHAHQPPQLQQLVQHLQQSLDQLSSTTNWAFVVIIAGLLCSATKGVTYDSRVLSLMRTMAESTFLHFKKGAASFLDNSASLVAGDYTAWRRIPWIAAASHPVATLGRLLSLGRTRDRFRELWKLSWNSCAVSVFSAGAVGAFIIGVPHGELLHGAPAKFAALLLMMSGGVACHLVFRLFGLPSEFSSTLLLYAVPQAIFLPILAALSLSSISLEHIILAGMHDQTLSLPAAFKYAVREMIHNADRVQGFRMTDRVSGLLSIALMVVFLEGYWQHYRVLRTKVYSVGVVAWVANFLLIVLPIPLDVAAAYWMR